MENLIKQEIFELEVLERLNSHKLLDKLVFTGGTMLRLCHGLDRYSVDLDFWLTKKADESELFNSVKTCLLKYYILKDSANKNYTILFEIKSNDYPNRLKIEIRKEIKAVKYNKSIAYSRNSNKQVIINTVLLFNMMEAKIKALIDRKEIRDAFDIEFLIKKGIRLRANDEERKTMMEVIESFKKTDYRVKLSSIVEPTIRKYYVNENFKILKSTLIEGAPTS